MKFCLLAAIVLCPVATAVAELPKNIPTAIPVWANGAPDSEVRAKEAEEVTGDNFSNVHNPTITPYIPKPEISTGTAIVICPGGGHSKLCLGHEGFELAEWFRDRGIAAFVLKYRLAREKGSAYTIQDHAMADTRRTLRLVRSKADEWKIRTDRLGIMGFSAGGELAAYAAMKSDSGNKESSDVIEQQGCRPDFQILIYPGSSGSFTAEAGMPPAFMAAGINDRPDISEGLASLYLKYKAAKVPAELHLYANAGHGFGYRHNAKPTAASRWPERCTEWLMDSGLLSAPESKKP